MAKNKVYWRLSRGWELFAIVLMLASLMALLQEVSALFVQGFSWTPHLTANIFFSGIYAFWVTILLFHLSSFFVVARSVIVEGRNRTSNVYDYTFGFVMIFSLYAIITAVMYGLYRGIPNIEFLWNISYHTLVRFGFFGIAISTLWFGFTD